MSNCVFCTIIERKSPSRIVYEDGRVIAFEDIAPQAPVHTLVAPKSMSPQFFVSKRGVECDRSNDYCCPENCQR